MVFTLPAEQTTHQVPVCDSSDPGHQVWCLYTTPGSSSSVRLSLEAGRTRDRDVSGLSTESGREGGVSGYRPWGGRTRTGAGTDSGAETRGRFSTG